MIYVNPKQIINLYDLLQVVFLVKGLCHTFTYRPWEHFCVWIIPYSHQIPVLEGVLPGCGDTMSFFYSQLFSQCVVETILLMLIVIVGCLNKISIFYDIEWIDFGIYITTYSLNM